MMLETEIQVVGLFVGFKPSQLAEQGNACVYTNPSIHTNLINILLYNHL
jgi:hypothetical protein